MAERDPRKGDQYRVTGRVWTIGARLPDGRIEVFEQPKDDDHSLRKTKMLVMYPSRLKIYLKDAEVLYVEP